MCCWLQPELLRVHLQVQYLSEVTNKPPGDTGRESRKIQIQNWKEGCQEGCGRSVGKYSGVVDAGMAKFCPGDPQLTTALQVSQRSSRSNEVRELQTFLVELHSRGNYSRELRVEPTLWSKHQMCASQKFACIVLATFLQLLLASQ